MGVRRMPLRTLRSGVVGEASARSPPGRRGSGSRSDSADIDRTDAGRDTRCDRTLSGHVARSLAAWPTVGRVWSRLRLVRLLRRFGPVAPPVAPGPAARADPPTGDGPLPIWGVVPREGLEPSPHRLEGGRPNQGTGDAVLWCGRRSRRSRRQNPRVTHPAVAPSVAPSVAPRVAPGCRAPRRRASAGTATAPPARGSPRLPPYPAPSGRTAPGVRAAPARPVGGQDPTPTHRACRRRSRVRPPPGT